MKGSFVNGFASFWPAPAKAPEVPEKPPAHNVAFETADGLVATLHVTESFLRLSAIVRPLRHTHRWMTHDDAMKYEPLQVRTYVRTGDLYAGLPIYKEEP